MSSELTPPTDAVTHDSAYWLGRAHGREEAERSACYTPRTVAGKEAERRAVEAQMPSVPEPLRRPMPPAEPYPLEALGPILAPAVQSVRAIIQVPEAVVAQAFLSAASLAAQPHADVLIDGRRELLSLFALTIAKSGERKSAADEIALHVHQKFEKDNLQRHEREKAEYEIDKLAYDAARRQVVTGSFPKGVAGDAREYIRSKLSGLGEVPKEPRKPILLAAAPTLEALHKIFAGGLPSVGLFNNDAGDVFGGHGMNEENCLKTAAGFSKLWDKGEYDRLRATDGLNKYFGRRLASHLMIQPIVAEMVLSNQILIGQGLLARCLSAWPESTIGYRPYREEDISQVPVLTTYSKAITDLLQREMPLAEGPDGERSDAELAPPPIVLSRPAKTVWMSIHDAIEEEMRPGRAYADVQPWAAKAPAQILRIAGVLTILEHGGPAEIAAEAVERGAALMRYYLGEARRMVGTAMIPAPILHAEAILKWCHDRAKSEVDSSDLLQHGPGAIREIEALGKAMTALQNAGWAIPIEGGKVIGGKKRRRVWTIRSGE